MDSAALRQAKFYHIYKMNPTAMALISLDNHLILDVNDSFEGLFGYARDDLLGLGFQQMAFWKQDESGRDFFELMAQQGRTSNLEVEYCKPGGEPGACLVSGCRIELEQEAFLLCCVVDTSAQKQLEKELRSSEERFYKAFHYSPLMMIVTHLADGLILDVNKTFEEQTGYLRQSVIGHDILKLKLWADDEERERQMAPLRCNRTVDNLPCTYHSADGTVRSGIMNAALINIDDQPCILTTILDNTACKQTEKQLARMDRLALVGEMAASIGHEIRNPMTSVRGFLQMISNYEATQPFRDHFDLMIEELDRANEIISSFLSMASNKSLELRLQSLSELVAILHPLILSDALRTDKNVCLELTSDEQVEIDHNEIRQLILNLARNGLEAMPPKGTLTIGTYRDGMEVVLFVKDQGPGLPPSIIESLGTPFLTTKESGTGLGLAVCYSIAARHKASLDLITGPEGTTFYVRFKTFVQGALWD